MKFKITYFLKFGMIVLAFIYILTSCHKENSQSTIKKFTIEEAMSWLENSFANNTFQRETKTLIGFSNTRKILWNLAVYTKKEKGEILEIPFNETISGAPVFSNGLSLEEKRLVIKNSVKKS